MIWGKYEEKNICVLVIISSAGLDNTAEPFTCINGDVFEGVLELEEVKRVLKGQSVSKKRAGKFFDYGGMVLAYFMIFQVFFDDGVNIDYKVAHRVHKSIKKFFKKNKDITTTSIVAYQSSLINFVNEDVGEKVNKKDIDQLVRAFLEVVKKVR